MIAKEIERAGIPIVQCCNMTPVAASVGVNRIYETPSIKYPFGVPEIPADDERKARRDMVARALEILTE